MALINNPPIGEPLAEKDGKARTSWSLWFGQVKRGSAFLGSFTTANRPPLKDLTPGTYGLDISLGANGKPVFVNKGATGWVLADGTAA